MLLAFEDYRLDIERRELRRAIHLISIEPKVFDLLVYLIQHRDRVVSKEELLQAVWSGRIVSDSALTTRINAVRRVLADNGASQRLIRTFTRKGVRFVAEVTEQPVESAHAHNMRGEAGPPDQPSIAVLPFQNLGGDPELDRFADGMAEEIITALSRIRWLFVISRNSSFTYKGQAADVKQVARELGVRYALEGSVRQAGDRVRVAIQLVEAESDAHLWADRFDGSLGDVFGLQDKVAYGVAGVVEPALQAAETARSRDHPTGNLSAYKAYLRAYAMLFASAKQIPQALASLEEAIARDPTYGPALAFAAHCCMRLCLDGWSKHPESDRRKGIGYARRALRLAGDDPGTLANSAMALAYLGEDIGAMTALVDRALMLNPSFARGWHISSMLRNWSGQSNLAIEHARTALQLSPRGGIGSPFLMIGSAHLLGRRLDEALAALLLATQDLPSDFPDPYRLLAACYARMGRLDEAREVIQRLRRMTPLVVEGFSHLRNSEHREFLLSGLRSAAGDTGRRSVHHLAKLKTQGEPAKRKIWGVGPADGSAVSFRSRSTVGALISLGRNPKHP